MTPKIKIAGLLALLFTAVSCASSGTSSRDTATDEKLGLLPGETTETEDAKEEVQGWQKNQVQTQRQQLERQITDPATAG